MAFNAFIVKPFIANSFTFIEKCITSASDSASVWDFKTGLELEWKSKSWSKSRFSKLRTKSLLKEYLSKKCETSALIKQSS